MVLTRYQAPCTVKIFIFGFLEFWNTNYFFNKVAGWQLKQHYWKRSSELGEHFQSPNQQIFWQFADQESLKSLLIFSCPSCKLTKRKRLYSHLKGINVNIPGILLIWQEIFSQSQFILSPISLHFYVFRKYWRYMIANREVVKVDFYESFQTSFRNFNHLFCRLA